MTTEEIIKVVFETDLNMREDNPIYKTLLFKIEDLSEFENKLEEIQDMYQEKLDVACVREETISIYDDMIDLLGSYFEEFECKSYTLG